jgi:predicted esterase YcpF (UPF0227 family)
VFIDDYEVYINENEIDTTSEFQYQTTREKCPMEIQRMEDERVIWIMKEENEELLNTSKMFRIHSFD